MLDSTAEFTRIFHANEDETGPAFAAALLSLSMKLRTMAVSRCGIQFLGEDGAALLDASEAARRTCMALEQFIASHACTEGARTVRRLTTAKRLEMAQAIVAVRAILGDSTDPTELRVWREQTSRFAVALHYRGGFEAMRDVAEVLFGLDESVHEVVCATWRSIEGYELWETADPEGLPE